MNRMTIVYHMAIRSDGKVVVTRVGKVCEDGAVVSTMTHSITLTADEARRMAEAMRATNGHFLKEDGFDTVDVWCEPYEAYQITWTRADGAEVCEPINCCEGAYSDGWSWEFAQALEDAASEAEAGE